MTELNLRNKKFKAIENKIRLLFQCLTKEGNLKTGESKMIISKKDSGKLKLKFDWS